MELRVELAQIDDKCNYRHHIDKGIGLDSNRFAVEIELDSMSRGGTFEIVQ